MVGAFFLWFFLIAPIAPDVFKSYLTLVTLISPLLLMIAFMAQFGQAELLKTFVKIQALFLTFSLVSYFALPTFARFPLWDGTIGPRLTGLGSHPNTVAALAALAIVITFSTGAQLKIQRNARIFIYIVSIGCLILTQSRTSMMAAMIGCSACLVLRLSRPLIPAIGLGLAGSAAILFSAINPNMLAVFSRSGRVDEITTGTGRTYVWNEAFRLIGESPWVGYGYNSTWYIFRDLQNDLAQFVGTYVFPHSHNLYIQILLSGGFIALTLFIITITLVAYSSISMKKHTPVIILACYLSYSMTESAGFFQYPESYIYMLFMAIAMNSHDQFVWNSKIKESRLRLLRARSNEGFRQ